ncbi:MAG: serine/threonine-protein kinase PknK, partial [Chloroflexota bacterium]
SLNRFFGIALKIVQSLDLIHQANVVHKDINPRNILIDTETNDIRLIDFGISSELSLERQDINTARHLEGSLPYISPEQTGRMNRDLDYRTDYYSLGATFYELLTSQQPFQADDLLGWVHCHISQEPVAPHQLNPQIPPMLSALILQLMAKNASDRYQSGYGLKIDLEHCHTEWNQTGKITTFTLKQEDISARFNIPQHLYGRDAEVSTLLDSFSQIAAGETVLVTVSGYSGVGKSALVQEVQKPIVGAKGYFIEGKFDQLQRNIPYSALSNAFRQLARQLLAEPAEQVASWKTALLDVFGPNGQIILDLVPELDGIVGPQPPVQALPPVEAQNRFQFLFLDFVKLFATAEHPLVIFLDDLQWSDDPTLNLLQVMATSKQLSHLMVIGAYRDNEVSAAHPLIVTLDTIKKEKGLHHLKLKPLNLTDVKGLVADTLIKPPDEISELVEIVYNKTEGNPFFVGELLKSFYQEGTIYFLNESGQWHWHIEQVRQAEVSSNVVEFMVANLKKLSPQTQQILQLAACIGNVFDLNTLSIIYEQAVDITNQTLLEALKASLIAPLDDDYKFVGHKRENSLNPRFKFEHDRVQQAAYALIEEDKRKAIHLSIGRLLQGHIPLETHDEQLITIVHHLNEGQDLLTNPQERESLANLNLKAGIKAKNAIAYQPALQYVTIGLALLEEAAWQHQYELTYALNIECADCLFLTGATENADAQLQYILEQVNTDLERASTLALQSRHYLTLARLEDAIRVGLAGLKSLGTNISYQPTQLSVLKELLLIRWNLGNRDLRNLLNSPIQTDPKAALKIQLIMEVGVPAYLTGNENLTALLILRAVNFSLRKGITPGSAFAYTSYGGVFLCGLFGDFKGGDQFGQLAIALSEQPQYLAFKSRTNFNLMRLKRRDVPYLLPMDS